MSFRVGESLRIMWSAEGASSGRLHHLNETLRHKDPARKTSEKSATASPSQHRWGNPLTHRGESLRLMTGEHAAIVFCCALPLFAFRTCNISTHERKAVDHGQLESSG